MATTSQIPIGDKLKAWLAPGIVVSIVIMALSFLSSYAGRKYGEGEQAAERKEMAHQILELKEQIKDNRDRQLSKEQFEEYVRGRTEADKTLTGILQDIRNRQR